ncbi:CPBP family intramembrane glutamic endopeptidase [Corynebacterium auriscanis]|uniref:CPBP family intramembrane glutamic endopeptidase n=1 Tax=Corynebacterium auriscanis TaxID=99807 RepID=UPI003CF5A2BD
MPLHPLVSLRHVLWAVALVVTSVAGAFALGFLFARVAKHLDAEPSAFLALGVMLGGVLPSLAVLYFGFWRACGWGRRELGFVAPRRSLWHLLWWTPLTVVVGAIGASIVGPLLGVGSEPPSPTDAGLSLPLPLVVVLLACVTVVVPLIEEIVFRRVLLDWLGRYLPMWLAAGITIVVFTVAHVSPAAMVYLIFTSTSLTLARLWFATLSAPLIIHSTNNALVALIVLLPA